ncbi:MAG: glycosyltransferase family 9 protein [Cetobacterium sp.]|uniref:glycosyltransferase family 9 protein n=1 Tax=Cetobacterium sp. TaxID=2071632 RepID=UPI003F393FA3
MVYLKKNYIIESINLYLIRWILKLFYRNSFNFSENKVLIKSADGIGDILIRSKLAEMLIEKYGKENIYFLVQEQYIPLGNILGYKTIGYSRKERKNFFSRLKKMKELNSMGFKEYINIEFTNELTVGNLFIPKRVGIIDKNPLVERNNNFYTEGYDISVNENIIEIIKKLGNKILEKNLSKEEIIPNLQNIFKSENNKSIVINVGSSSREKVCSPYRMIEYIKIILESSKEREIFLVGTGKDHEEYAEIILKEINNNKIKNLVGKTNLFEVFNIIGKCDIFIGFDSGLYNFSYCMRKKTIGIFKGPGERFEHKCSWVKILTPDYEEKNFKDEKYKNIKMNSISTESFRKALGGFLSE